jgi:hypothetical protein
MEKIIENAKIIYKNGKKEFYNAITVEENGIYTGNVKFINQSYIPKNQIQKIIFLNKNGKSKNIDLKKSDREEINNE